MPVLQWYELKLLLALGLIIEIYLWGGWYGVEIPVSTTVLQCHSGWLQLSSPIQPLARDREPVHKMVSTTFVLMRSRCLLKSDTFRDNLTLNVTPKINGGKTLAHCDPSTKLPPA